MRFLKFLGIVLLAALLLGLVATLRTPRHLWWYTQEFAACPLRPSCVSSRADDPVHGIAPLSYQGDRGAAQARLKAVMRALPGASLAHEQEGYLHAVFVTPRLRFHDDVEFLVQPDGRIEARSISRFGYRDYGVNRGRIERIRALYNAASAAPAR